MGVFLLSIAYVPAVGFIWAPETLSVMVVCADHGNNRSLLPSARVQSAWSFTSTYPIYFHSVVLEARDNSLKNHRHSFTYFVYVISLLNIIAALWKEEEQEEVDDGRLELELELEMEENMDMKNKECGV